MNRKEFIRRDCVNRVDLGLRPLAEIERNEKKNRRLKVWFLIITIFLVAKFIHYLAS